MNTQPSPQYVAEVLAEVDRRNQQRLKPCKRCTPLIGNGVLLTLFHMTESDIGGYYPASVMCEQCHRQIWGRKTDESAIVAWNKAQQYPTKPLARSVIRVEATSLMENENGTL